MDETKRISDRVIETAGTRGRDRFRRYARPLQFLASAIGLLPKPFRLTLGHVLRNTPGTVGLGLRYAWLAASTREIGQNVALYPGAHILSPENLVLGSNVSIHPMCYLDATGGIEIGNDVSIAHGATIMSTTHHIEPLGTLKDAGYRAQKTIIERGVWIGAKASILFGVRVGQDAIVGAHALVNRDVKESSIVVGNPAKEIRKRG